MRDCGKSWRVGVSIIVIAAGLLWSAGVFLIRWYDSGTEGLRVVILGIAHFEEDAAASRQALVEALPLLRHGDRRDPSMEEWEAIHRDRDQLRILWDRHRENLERLRWNYRGIIHTHVDAPRKHRGDWDNRVGEIGNEIELLDWYGGRLRLERDAITEGLREYEDRLLREDTEHRRLYLEYLERQAEIERMFGDESR